MTTEKKSQISKSKCFLENSPKILIVDNTICTAHMYQLLWSMHVPDARFELFHTHHAGQLAIDFIKNKGYVPDIAMVSATINGVNGATVVKALLEKADPLVFGLISREDKPVDSDQLLAILPKDRLFNKYTLNFKKDILPKVHCKTFPCKFKDKTSHVTINN